MKLDELIVYLRMECRDPNDFKDAICGEAANEIERLRKLVKEQGQEIAITREQDERLLSALSWMEDYDPDMVATARSKFSIR